MKNFFTIIKNFQIILLFYRSQTILDEKLFKQTLGIQSIMLIEWGLCGKIFIKYVI